MKKITHYSLAKEANKHLNYIILSSKQADELLFKLGGFYGGLLEILKEDKYL